MMLGAYTVMLFTSFLILLQLQKVATENYIFYNISNLGSALERSLRSPEHAAISSTRHAGLLRCSYFCSSLRDFY